MVPAAYVARLVSRPQVSRPLLLTVYIYEVAILDGIIVADQADEGFVFGAGQDRDRALCQVEVISCAGCTIKQSRFELELGAGLTGSPAMTVLVGGAQTGEPKAYV